MELWAAATLFMACTLSAVIFIKFYRKSKKTGFIVLTVILSLLALVLLAYFGLIMILLKGIR